MNTIKEFLKPNWWKVGILIPFVLLGGGFLLIFELSPEFFLKTDLGLYIHRFIFLALFLPSFFFGIILGISDGPRTLFPVLLSYSIGPLFWYLLSCLIYSIFRKFKPRKQASQNPL